MVYIFLLLFFVFLLLLLANIVSNTRSDPDTEYRLTEEQKEILREDYITHSVTDRKKDSQNL